tara:strand:- start:54 stop:566 length:513 start_codon:yes stop_codon:yes gene_type:complete
MRSDIINNNSLKFGDGADFHGDAMPLQYKEKIVLLTDQASATTIRDALTMADSGTHFIVPALTSGAQSITLPAVNEDNVGFWCRFTMLATAAQVFSVDTAASADKIITAEPDGDGTLTISASANGFNFTAAALVGASFKVTMISATAATAFWVSDLRSAIAAQTGEHVAE